MTKVSFNINEYVWFDIIEKGKEHLHKWFIEHSLGVTDYSFNEYFKKHLDNNLIKMQMHEFMDIFGGSYYPDFFKLNIFFNDKDLIKI